MATADGPDRAEGNYRDAVPAQRLALGIGRKTLGPAHPDVAMSLENGPVLLTGARTNSGGRRRSVFARRPFAEQQVADRRR